MLFKRFIEGKSVLKNRREPSEGSSGEKKCDRRKSECVADFCADHSTLIEETVKMSLLGCVLWAGLTLGSWVAPYPLNLIVSADTMHPPPIYDFPFPSAENLRRLPPITTKHTNRSVSLAEATIKMLSRLEENLQASGIVAKEGTTAKGLLLHGYPNAEGMHYDVSSMVVMRATENLVATRCSRFGLRADECGSFISTLALRGSLGGECAVLERFDCVGVSGSRYRTFDGSCNNPMRASWGQALTGYRRLLHPKYADGVDEPRLTSAQRELPSARLVSSTLTGELAEPHSTITMAFAVWAQFVHHDLAHTPVKKMVHSGAAIRCCDESGRTLSPRHRHPSCMPIAISQDDPYFNRTYSTCMEYVRSATTYRGDCTFGASEQMNQASHFLDLSNVYGSSSKAAARLRQPTGGLLRTEVTEAGEMLPQSVATSCLNGSTCFESGDLRANLHPWLTALHIVWAREHNRIATALAKINAGWSAERLYHEARRIVIAEAQAITYKHWLTKLSPSLEDIFDDFDTYNQEVDPTVTNSFATAAFSFVHSLLDGDILMLDKDGAVENSLELMGHYYKPNSLKESGAVEKIIRGMIRQRSQQMDLNFVDDVRHGWLGGLDALAIDIQRGRDHALPSYHHYRTLCKLPHVDTMQQMSDVMSQEAIDKLSSLYAHAHDIDLVVGGVAETPAPGSLLGPTFTCIIKEQLRRSRAGDRFFYTHSEGGGFTRRQLLELGRVSLARVLCDNSPGLNTVARDVFAVPGDDNPEVSCEDIRRVNLEAWRDDGQADILSRTQTNVKKWIKTRVNG